jgi:hypothetical protein
MCQTVAADTGKPDGEVLYAHPARICEWVPEPESDSDPEECGALSRFRVERDSSEPGYEPAESCEKHLGAVVPWVIDGAENVRAIVTVRWDWYDETHVEASGRAATSAAGPDSNGTGP